ncbi:hypothetical protein I4U23_019657 [Adineta vaga]|nr:hypothetical protein I4U23_019657 [Adineta vaga]
MTFSIASFLSCLIMAMVIVGQNQTRNICDWIYCTNNGTCQQVVNSTQGYRCRCHFGFTGLLCENRVNISVCVKNPCEHNGTCTIANDGKIKCMCPKQYKGTRCEILI